MVDVVSIVFLLCGISYFVGYYANGLFGTHFELNSIGMAVASFTGAGVMSTIKYITDSCKNSAQGEIPFAQLFTKPTTQERTDIK